MRLPEVSANFALSLDGKIVSRVSGTSGVTSVGDRRRKMDLRAGADAILVGQDILETGDMLLRIASLRLRNARKNIGKSAEPLRVVFAESARLRENLRIFRGGAPVVVFGPGSMPLSERRRLEKLAHVHIVSRGNKINTRQALALLARDYGVRSVVCEGGAALFRSLVASRLVHKLHVTFLPLVVGGADVPTLLGPSGKALLKRSIALKPDGFRQQGGEVFASYLFPRMERAH